MSTFKEKTASAKSGVKKFFKRLLILLLVIFIGVMLFFYYGVYSTGVRGGTVLKVSKKGAVFKTWEGQMDIGSFGAVRSDNQLSQTFEFSIDKNREDLINRLEEAALSGERVRIRYEEKYVALPWRGDTKYFVTDVEEAKSGEMPDRTGFPE